MNRTVQKQWFMPNPKLPDDYLKTAWRLPVGCLLLTKSCLTTCLTTKCAGWRKLSKQIFANRKKFLTSRILICNGMQDHGQSAIFQEVHGKTNIVTEFNLDFWIWKIPRFEKINPWVGNSNDSNVVCGSCHFDWVSNDEFNVECLFW